MYTVRPLMLFLSLFGIYNVTCIFFNKIWISYIGFKSSTSRRDAINVILFWQGKQTNVSLCTKWKRVKHPNYIGIILCTSANNQSYYLVIVTDFINGIHNLLTFDGIFILIRTSASTKNKATYDFEIARMSETFYGGKIE